MSGFNRKTDPRETLSQTTPTSLQTSAMEGRNLSVSAGDRNGIRFRVEQIFLIAGAGNGPYRRTGVILAGVVEVGTIRIGQNLSVRPADPSRAVSGPFEVERIMEKHRAITEAGSGRRIGVTLQGIERDDARKGDCLIG